MYLNQSIKLLMPDFDYANADNIKEEEEVFEIV